MNRERFAKQLVLHEALAERGKDGRIRPYTDSVGKLTIGIGRNLTDRGISEKEAYMLCENDIADVEKDLDANLPWWRSMSEIRQRVLADMVFNMGMPTVLTFGNTLRFMQEGQYELAATNMLKSKWATQVGKRATRLAEMMRTGADSPDIPA